MLSRGRPKYFEGLNPDDIEWVWIWDIRRRATAKEIQLLCGAKR